MSETKETHVHVLEDGTVVEHSHEGHGHHHSHAQTKAVLNRLSRAIGHLESIKRMVEEWKRLFGGPDPAFCSQISH